MVNQAEIQIIEATASIYQVRQLYDQIKSISFCWLAMEELDANGQVNEDLIYFQEGTQLYFCSKQLNKLIAKINFLN